MHVDVLNGVNLDVLGRRDPQLYGGLSTRELETRIYEWANELDLRVRCRQTNHEGQYVDWCHEALDWRRRRRRQPGAWTHYSYAIRDAVELFTCPVVEVHLSNIDEREEWRRHSVIADLAAKRVIGKGPGRLPRGARVPGGDGTSEQARPHERARRLDGVRAAIEEPLLVTNAGQRPLADRAATARTRRCSSSPTACGSSPTSATSRRRATGLEVVEIAARAVREAGRAAAEAGRVRVRGSVADVRAWAALDAGGLEPCRDAASSRRCARSRTTGELDAIRRAAAITNETFERLAEERFVGRTEKRARLVDRVD